MRRVLHVAIVVAALTCAMPTGRLAAQSGSAEPTRVDVLVVYTPRALELAGGGTAMQTLIDLYVRRTNEWLARSDARTVLRLVGLREVPYDERAHPELVAWRRTLRP